MDEIEIQPQEISEASEGSERDAVQELDDATYEPRDYVEQSGNYQQAEAIQTGFTAVVDSVASRAFDPIPMPHTAGESSDGVDQVGCLPTPIPRPGEGSGGAGSENLSNINLPNVRDEQSKPYSEEISHKGPGGPETGPGGPGSHGEGPGGEPHDSFGSGGNDTSSIAPANLPGMRSEDLPGRAPVSPAGESGTRGKMDPDTGNYAPPTGSTGESQSNPTASLRGTSNSFNLAGTTGEGLPHVELPPAKKMADAMPLGSHVLGESSAAGTPGSRGSVSQALTGPQEIDVNSHFADQALNAIGMGPQGLLGNSGMKGAQGKTWGVGPGAPGHKMPGGPAGSPTGSQNPGSGNKGSSGGGPPVNMPGGQTGESVSQSWKLTTKAGEKSSGSANYTGHDGNNLCGTVNASAEKNANSQNARGASGSITVTCDNGRSTTYSFGGSKKAYTLDSSSPIPYTGSGSWGNEQPRDPGIFGGSSDELKEAGHFAPVISHDGKSGGGGGGGGDPSIYDDGNWYGGIFGGGDGRGGDLDPGGFDYYTPNVINVIENITKK